MHCAFPLCDGQMGPWISWSQGSRVFCWWLRNNALGNPGKSSDQSGSKAEKGAVPRLRISHHRKGSRQGWCLWGSDRRMGPVGTQCVLLSKQYDDERPTFTASKRGEVPLQKWLPDIRLILLQGDWRSYFILRCPAFANATFGMIHSIFFCSFFFFHCPTPRCHGY